MELQLNLEVSTPAVSACRCSTMLAAPQLKVLLQQQNPADFSDNAVTACGNACFGTACELKLGHTAGANSSVLAIHAPSPKAEGGCHHQHHICSGLFPDSLLPHVCMLAKMPQCRLNNCQTPPC